MAEQEFIQALDKIYDVMNQGLRNKDVDMVASLFHDDACVMAPGMSTLSGKDGVRASIEEGLIKLGIVKFALDWKEVILERDTGVARGEHKAYSETDQCLYDGKFVIVWKKVNGVWKKYIDMFNPNK